MASQLPWNQTPQGKTAYERLCAHMARHYPDIGCSSVRDAHPAVIDAVLTGGGMLNKVATLQAMKQIDPHFYRTGGREAAIDQALLCNRAGREAA